MSHPACFGTQAYQMRAFDSLSRDAIEIPLPAQVKFAADQGRRSAEGVAQAVERQDLGFGGMAEHDRRAVAVRDVNAAGGSHGRSVYVANVVQPDRPPPLVPSFGVQS